VIEYGHAINPRLREKYKRHGLADKVYVWCLFDICVPNALKKALDGYLCDEQIETELFKIIDGVLK